MVTASNIHLISQRDSILKRSTQFSKVGRLASEEVVISLLRAKCLPVLLYSVEACPVLVRDKQSLEFTITRSLMKLFRTDMLTS